MPEVNGLELARTISAEPAWQGLPMIMLTSSLQLDPEVLHEAGIAQWLTKPVRSSELYDRLMRLMAPHKEAASSGQGQGQPRRPSPPQTGSAGQILVVEDNSLNQLVAEGVVSRLGYEVHSVSNGLEAVEAVGSADYSAVLMDWHMPVMDGFTATREIRARQVNGRRTPIIAMTAGALSEDRERCLAAGMDDYVSKPVDLEALAAVLSRWVEQSALRSGESLRDTSPDGADKHDQSETPIDESRLAGLRDLVSPDGSSVLAQILDHFLSLSVDRMAALRLARQAGDVDRVREVAHELKGGSGNIGASRVAALCGELEVAARRLGAMPDTRLLDELELELERATAALGTYSGARA